MSDMTDYKFLKLMKATGNKRLNIHELSLLSGMDENNTEQKIDHLIEKNFITETNLKDSYNGNDMILSSRYPSADSSWDKYILINTFFVSDEGNEFLHISKSTIWDKRRSWIALTISFVALVFSILVAIFK